MTTTQTEHDVFLSRAHTTVKGGNKHKINKSCATSLIIVKPVKVIQRIIGLLCVSEKAAGLQLQSIYRLISNDK